MKTALLIPAYQPKENTLPFLMSFRGDEFDEFLVVDDGSGEAYKEVFDSIEEQTCFQVLSYPINKGKGGALKEGIRFLCENGKPDVIITADSDGQHLYHDIVRLRDEAFYHPHSFILGMRRFDGPNVPAKSSAGNRFSSFYAYVATGEKIVDTQTGLRAIPKKLFPLALSIEGERYEYEFNFLIEAVHRVGWRHIDIETVYENNNEGSHFRPFRDAMRVAKSLIAQIFLIGGALGLGLGLFALFSYLFASKMPNAFYAVAGPAVLSSAIAGTLYILGVLQFASPDRENVGYKALRYILAVVAMMGLSIFAVYGLSYLTDELVLMKFLVDSLILIASLAAAAIRVQFKARGRRKHESQSTNALRNSYDLD